MQWKGRRESDQVEDARGERSSGSGASGYGGNKGVYRGQTRMACGNSRAAMDRVFIGEFSRASPVKALFLKTR
jgi:predicted metalloprotease